MTRTIRRLPWAAVGLALILAPVACGEDDTSSRGSSTQESDDSTDASPEGANDGAAAVDAEDDDSSSDGPVGARVVIDGQEFEATTQVTCIEMGDAFGAYFLTDDETLSIDISLPPENWESDTQNAWDPPGVRVDVGDEFQFVAGFEELDSPDGPHSSIASFDLGDGHAEGAGTFIDNFELFGGGGTPSILDGTFEVTCGD